MNNYSSLIQLSDLFSKADTILGGSFIGIF